MKGLIIALGATAMIGMSGVAGAADVTVLRGDAVETVRVSGAGPTVLRGGGTMRAAPPSDTVSMPHRSTYAGTTLWQIADNQRITACFLVRTEYAGKRKIRCTTARY